VVLGKRTVLPLPRAGRTLVLRLLVKCVFQDVYAHFFGGLRSAIQDITRETLAAFDGPVIVVGHSLGSVISYDVLRQDARVVPLFLTLGSPLELTEIQGRARQYGAARIRTEFSHQGPSRISDGRPAEPVLRRDARFTPPRPDRSGHRAAPALWHPTATQRAVDGEPR